MNAPGYILAPQLSLLGHADVVGFGSPDFCVRSIPKTEADALIVAGHYSRSVVWSSSVHLGVFSRGRCVGALQFGVGMNPASGASVVSGTQPDQWLELNRMWLRDDAPPQSASRSVSYALKYLRRARPAVAWVQSFADERCGKWGAVYQACSFLYLGSHEATFYLLDGEWFHKSMMGRSETDRRGWGCGPKIRRFLAGQDRAEAHVFRQFRYFHALKTWARAGLLLPVLPYEKPNADKKWSGSSSALFR